MTRPGFAERLARRRMTRRDFLWLASTSAATAVAPALSGCATSPVTGQPILVGLSEKDEADIDRRYSANQFSRDYGVVQDASLNRYVNEVMTGLARTSHRPQVGYSGQVVNATYVNAYTFPGGSMAATRGILLDLESEDELAALLGHELGHVNARHSAQQAGQSMVASAVVTAAAIAVAASDARNAGLYAQAAQLFGSIGSSALLASYSRDNEREADALGMQYMTRAGYNPQGMVELMEMLNTQHREQPGLLETMFATHPMSDERLATAREAAGTAYRGAGSRPLARERYMDQTAPLRAQKPAIASFQEGQRLMQGKKLPDAETAFGDGLAKAPEDYAGLCMMARCQIAQRKPAEAREYLARARAVYPTEAQAMQLAGVSALALKDYGRAYAELDAYDRRLPGDPGVAFLKGVSQEGMGNRQAAAQEYARYVRAVPQGTQSQYAVQRLRAWGYAR
jgi:predicted Zn-dependent protease